MDEQEYRRKYTNLRILKSVQDYLKSDTDSPTALYPLRVPDDLLYQVVREKGSEAADKLLHHIFKMGLTAWSEKLYNEAFGSEKNLEAFIELVKKRTKE
ncbi:MAG: hypothetical protein JRI79_12735 [Deltaproteobacteria bacterium]|nr:hypothetical protein [Deltaproteobacteria bacterium]MBW1920261.1 hypothetical protein [Deltaproteobacteria bacterium]MBW1936430.1 hypothetical protein [Deltaproteobacteria bacterium]MBW1978816.1 hypothetical protein [Deltaproteobacteria bacterium]MBW2044798.1 hypothetical protein [Deltaproteobacteria bacterium]